eukprot:TRINITY_DN30279_c0_g1_i1.p1 TRINITY_DN30279_c0_g1~~TRINITY_DN30279_c0_g1_i1.p1  ORF type:complete len:245 (+),score=50.85 TRINITY_DN30279_c0_g1_i1:134-868(+)
MCIRDRNRQLELGVDQDTLHRMVASFQDNSDNKTSTRTGWGTVMKDYEEQVQSPIKSLVVGSLMEAILIQVQKVKVDSSSALVELDQVMKQQQLNIQLMAMIPVLAAGTAGYFWIQNAWRTQTVRRRERARIALHQISRQLLRVQAMEGAELVSGEEGDQVLGRIALCCSHLTHHLHLTHRDSFRGTGLLSNAEALEFESDLQALVLSLIHISEPTRLLSISYAVFCLKKKSIRGRINRRGLVL